MDGYEPQTVNAGYKVITLFFLSVISPIGFFFLWSPKLKWPLAVKIALTILSPVLMITPIFILLGQ